MNHFLSGSRGSVYYKIQMHPLSLSERDVVRALDQSRFDPRLMEIMTEFIRDFWWNLDPIELKKASKKAKSPFMLKAATAVILDRCKINTDDRIHFVNWLKQAVQGIKDPTPQLLYIGVIPVASSMIQEEIKGAIPCFFKHNLITKDLPFNKGKPGTLKTESNPSENKVNSIDLLKVKLARRLKKIKSVHQISNEDIIRASGINRVFLSKILNNKLENISIEYLNKKILSLENRFPIPLK